MEALLDYATDSFARQGVIFEVDTSQSIMSVDELSAHQGSEITKTFETFELSYVGRGSVHGNADLNMRQSRQGLRSFFGPFIFSSESPRPHLKLIRIYSRFAAGRAGSAASFSMGITGELFEELLDAMKMNPWAYWLMSNKYDGYHYMKAQGNYADTYFLGFFHSFTIWTFDPCSFRTTALLISRDSGPRDTLFQVLRALWPCLWTPHVPLLASITSQLVNFDDRLDSYVNEIIEVEKGTGFSWLGQVMRQFSFDVDSLATWSRVSSSVQINIVNLLRHHETCMGAIGTVERLINNKNQHCPSNAHKLEYDKANADILDAIDILRMRAAAFVPYAQYIKSRAEAQISVIFSLLTHEDSIANLKAAEAAKDIAKATKQDSSAMKTIAFMTMAFLPATFLATFFALPMLQWDRKTTVQTNGFSLYWIVAVLSTVFVFALWAIITNRKLVWGWSSEMILAHRKKQGKT